MPITEELLDAFLEEHQIEDADDLELFSDMIHLLFAEPNVPLHVITSPRDKLSLPGVPGTSLSV